MLGMWGSRSQGRQPFYSCSTWRLMHGDVESLTTTICRCKDEGGARAVACACTSNSNGMSHLAFRSASGPACGTAAVSRCICSLHSMHPICLSAVAGWARQNHSPHVAWQPSHEGIQSSLTLVIDHRAMQAQSSKPCWLDWADALPARHLLGSSTVTSPDGTSQTSVSGNGQAAAITPTSESVQASADHTRQL